MRLAFLVDCVSGKEGSNRTTNRLTVFCFSGWLVLKKPEQLTGDQQSTERAANATQAVA